MPDKKVSMRNKLRGRAFQTQLARMSGGMNVGTLGGEDVMHEEFSYEAKTYLKNCKTNKGKDWRGEEFMSMYDLGLASTDLVVIKVSSSKFSDLVLIRWKWWKLLIENEVKERDILKKTYLVESTVFKGNGYMKQAEKNCPDAKVPVVVVHTTGRRHDQDIVVIRELYFDSLLEKLFDK